VAHVPARVTTLPFIGTEDEVIDRARDADALVIASAPVTRGVMGALEGLKVVVRTGVGYDVIDVPAATELGVIVVNIPDIWVREVANHAAGALDLRELGHGAEHTAAEAGVRRPSRSSRIPRWNGREGGLDKPGPTPG
jgi:phosphoglycerate dehydrogenase-like enzyme